MHDNRLHISEDVLQTADRIWLLTSEPGFQRSMTPYHTPLRKRLPTLPGGVTLDILRSDREGLDVPCVLRRQFKSAQILFIRDSDPLSSEMTESLGMLLRLSIDANLSALFQVPEGPDLLERNKLPLDEKWKFFEPTHGNRHRKQ